MGDGRLRVITGEVAPVVETRDPQRFQAECVEAFVASWTTRGFAESTIANDVDVLERMLAALGRPVWEVTVEDVDRVVGELASSGRAVSTRRNYLQVFKGFHRFLEVRKAAEIEAAFGVRLACPLDEFNAARHVSDDSPAGQAPPTPERVAGFFEFLKSRIATARKYAPAARDYMLFRTLYHAGLRSEEVVMLDRSDVHFGHGTFGKLHVRFGKGAKGSGPRPRWVPMLDGLDLLLRWYLDDVRGRFPDSAVLLCDESGGRMAAATIRNRLRHLMTVEGRPESVLSRIRLNSDAVSGSTYTANAFTTLCRQLGIRQSMGRVGSCFDNAAAEAFFSSLEWEVLSRNRFRDTIHAHAVVIDWCYTFYNHQRRRSTADGLTRSGNPRPSRKRHRKPSTISGEAHTTYPGTSQTLRHSINPTDDHTPITEPC